MVRVKLIYFISYCFQFFGPYTMQKVIFVLLLAITLKVTLVHGKSIFVEMIH